MRNRDFSNQKPVRETRWHREYALEEKDHFLVQSKFSDGSASITLKELEREWPGWDEGERIDFCQALGFSTVPNESELLRFVMRHGDHSTWSGCALSIVHCLPAEETMPFLLSACRTAPVGKAANLLQALTKSGTPEAHGVLRNHLERLWANPCLMKKDEHFNSLGSETVFCLRDLLELGERDPELTRKYHALLNHPDDFCREQAKNFLSPLMEG